MTDETDKVTMMGVEVLIKPEDLNCIVDMSFDKRYSFGCFCDYVEFIKPDGTHGIMGEYGSEQISLGGSIIYHDDASTDAWELTKEKLLKGMKLILRDKNDKKHLPLEWEDGKLYVSSESMDAIDVDAVIQYALFGEWILG